MVSKPWTLAVRWGKVESHHGFATEGVTMRARLIVESGLASPRVCDLDDSEVVSLGRNRDSTIVLQDKHASRRHARVFCVNNIWYICDQGTTNGTRIDGAPVVREVPLADGQLVSIGDVRLRFHIPRGEGEPADEPHMVNAPTMESSDTTLFQADELTALFRFMNSSLTEATPHGLVTQALQAILRQTGADLAGFLSLDAQNPELRLVLPAQAAVDQRLSHHLTQQVLREGRSVWLCSPDANRVESDSLSDFHDAICIPLRASPPPNATAIEAPLGSLHVYKTTRPFTERQVRFVEVLAGSLAATLHVLRARCALEADNSRLRVHVAAAGDDLIGASAAMDQLRHQIRMLADGPCTVLVFGESGVGKELVALALHRQSARHRGPLITVNCAAITGTLAESELFGHVRGAFSGATRDHPGFFAQADMGTLFLDELGELPPDLQSKLLRAIETRSFRPVGARADVRADVRIVVATNRDLEQEVREGRFRRDLYYRLTSRIDVPPLRDHLEDVPVLARHFLAHLNKEYRKNVTLSEAALERLKTSSWPGNVRQLRSVLEGAVALAAQNGTIHAGDLRLANDLFAVVPDRPESLDLVQVEMWAIRHALTQTSYNNTHAARLLGIHRDTLIEKLKRYGIKKPE
jgi:two-component system response regulator HydG